ncbi:hypothetical protein NC653_024097 [Populus alba x Populus x berolinensis]|uniref:Uncharacterized protein n=1 Tax=Populus alba x Populus x berolinensis TaxID=444605 RepID=A0AAD6M826_9ROSI|nr:hypothetical protein NC653_024097 [Populus alba x Populus x berolinensis]
MRDPILGFLLVLESHHNLRLSDSSLSNAINRQMRAMIYQEQIVQTSHLEPTGLLLILLIRKINTISDPNTRVQIQQQASGFWVCIASTNSINSNCNSSEQQLAANLCMLGAHYIQYHPMGQCQCPGIIITVFIPSPAANTTTILRLIRHYPVYYVQARPTTMLTI